MNGRSEITRAFIRSPLLRAVVPFVLGLGAGKMCTITLSLAWGMVVVAALVWVWMAFRHQQYRTRWRPGAAMWLLLLCFGLLWQRLHTVPLRPGFLGGVAAGASGWVVEVAEVASEKERSTRVWAEAQAALLDGEARPVHGRLLVTLLREGGEKTLHNGDRLLLDARATPIQRIPAPGGFDARQWAASRGTWHECIVPPGQWTLLQAANGGPGFFVAARDWVSQRLRGSTLPDDQRALVKAILLGLRDEMAPEQNQAFVQSGTIHALAVSGSHVGIIYVAVLWALGFMGKDRWARVLRGCAILAALWMYAGLTGWAPSVLRATLMFSLFTVAEMARTRTEPLNSLACAAGVLLLWDPSMLDQLGFQLSFLAVLGIAVFYRPLYQLWAPRTLVGRFFWSLFAVSLVAQAFTLPLCLYVFHAFPVWFLPANMAIVGLVGLGVYGGALLLVFHAVPVLGAFLTALMSWLMLLLGWLSVFFGHLPGAYPAVRIGGAGMLGLYLLLMFLSLWLMARRRWARMAACATLALLLFGWGWTARQRNEQRQFAVYGDRQALACCFVEGRTLHVFTSGQSPWTERNLLDHARAMGIRKVVTADSLPGLVVQGGRAVVFLDLARTPGALPAKGPLTLVAFGAGIPDLTAFAARPGLQWVVAANAGGKARRLLKQYAASEGMEVFDAREAGAYVRP